MQCVKVVRDWCGMRSWTVPGTSIALYLERPSCAWNVPSLCIYFGGDILILPNPGNSPVHDVSCRGVGGLETGARGSIFLREGWYMVAKASEPSEATVP